MAPKSYTKKPNHQKKNWMREHYVRQGLTMTEVGNLSGVSAMTIRAWLVKLEIPTRPRGARHPLNPKWRPGTPAPYSQDSQETRADDVFETPEMNPKKGKVSTINNNLNADPAILHLRTLRDKLKGDLATVENAISLIESI